MSNAATDGDPQTLDDAESNDAVWRDRAIERSTRAARERAAVRVQQFLNAAREIIAEKGSTEFTVQEVVDRSKQSLRSFYQYFDGKHELLLALFEEEMGEAVARVKRVTVDGDPLDRLRADGARALRTVFALRVVGATVVPRVRPTPARDPPERGRRPPTHPCSSTSCRWSEEAGDAGLLRPGRPRRLAAIVLQAATTTAGRSAGGRQPITASEMWEFCLHAIAPDSVVAGRLQAA